MFAFHLSLSWWAIIIIAILVIIGWKIIKFAIKLLLIILLILLAAGLFRYFIHLFHFI